MLQLLTIIIALVCVLLTLIILIQSPKGGGIDSTLGGSGANQLLGASRSADFVEKLTWYFAIGLFVLCIIAALTVGTVSEPQIIK